MTARGRIGRLATHLRDRSLPALLVTNLADVRYLTGFTGSNGVLVVRCAPRVSARFFTDGRYTVQARHEVQGATVRIATKSALTEACQFVAKHDVVCGFDRSSTTVAALQAMKKAAGAGVRFAPCDGAVSALRTVKDQGEAAALRRAAQLTCDLYETLLPWIEAGMTETDVAAELEYRARRAGAQGMSFETIVASGQRGSQPHARATGATLRRGDLVTLDFGIVLDGYCSDMTRTVALGFSGQVVPKAQKGRWNEQRDVFEAVLAAQQAAVLAVRPGATGGDVDRAARSVLQTAGYGNWFTHSTGHGVGLEIHEAPRIGKESKDVLKAGTVITIEPGAYLPGRFGVRIEDTVLVTDNGAEVLTPVHKGWMEL